MDFSEAAALSAPGSGLEYYFSVLRSAGRIVVQDPPHFDLESYAQSYKGQNRFDRLLLIGQASVPLCVDALKAAVAEAKRGRDVGRYRMACAALRVAAPDAPEAELDRAWADATAADNRAETLRLEKELKMYKNNLVKESIRMGHEELGRHLEACGDMAGAIEAFNRMRPDVSTPKHIVDMSKHLVRVAVKRGEWAYALTQVNKIAGLQGVGSGNGNGQGQGNNKNAVSPLQPYVRTMAGVAQLGLGKYAAAAKSFLEVDMRAGGTGNSSSQGSGPAAATSPTNPANPPQMSDIETTIISNAYAAFQAQTALGPGPVDTATAAAATTAAAAAAASAAIAAASAAAAEANAAAAAAATAAAAGPPHTTTAATATTAAATANDGAVARFTDGLVGSNDVAVYGGLTALATMNRHELQTLVLDNPRFRAFLELEPHVRRAISQFVHGRYAACLAILEAYRPDYLLDLFLHKHVAPLYARIRSKCLVSYLAPYSCVTLATMNAAFAPAAGGAGAAGSPSSVEDELAAMIASGVVRAKIDAVHGLVRTVRDDPRARMQREGLAHVATMERDTVDRLRRMNVLAAGLEVRGTGGGKVADAMDMDEDDGGWFGV